MGGGESVFIFVLLCKYIPGLYEGRGQTLHYFSLLFYYSKPDNKKYLSHMPGCLATDMGTYSKADNQSEARVSHLDQ